MDDIAKTSSAEGKMAEMYQLTHRPVSCFCSQEFYIWQFFFLGGGGVIICSVSVTICALLQLSVPHSV